MSNDKFNFKPKVKPYEIVAILAMIAIMILISTQVHLTHPLKTADPIDLDHLDPTTARLTELIGAQVVPGKSVGKIRLGDLADTATTLIGQPKLGDAAMCKSWARWEWGSPLYVLEVFSSCDPKQDMKKTVQQIRFSGIPFETQDGVSLKSTFTQISQHYTGLVAEATFTDKSTGRQMIVMDQIKQGIAFVVDANGKHPNFQGKCQMMIIHPPGKKAIDTYLQPQWDLHPL